MSLSLVPYHPREGREIVLRHHDAIVVRDPASQRLEIRGLTACPTCHQPLRPSSPERSYDAPSHQESFVDPDYFRMLRAGHGLERPDRAPPASPTRRLVQPFLQDEQGAAAPVQHIEEEAEFISSTPDVHEGSRIRREAFSPRYFKTFFVEERELGRGGKGIVLLVRHEIDGCHLGHFACKRVPVGDDHAWLEKVLIEVELLAKLSHPNLVSYRHVWLEDVRLTRFGPPVACAFILQQYCNSGDLLHYVAGDQPKETTKEELKAQMRRRSKGQIERTQDIFPGQRQLPLEEIYSLFRDITAGLAYLHAANYIHRDLKPSNCLLHREGKSLICLISDFGEVQPENAVRKSTGSTGTISYCAPEVLRRDASGRYGNFTTKSDIFSLGMILYFMCFGRLPYQSANAIQEELEDIDLLRAEITDWKGFQDERRERPELPGKLYQLLKKLLSVNPADRPSASEVLTALKNESSLDGVARGARSASPTRGFQSRRVQSLDSPMAPSTPVPGLYMPHPNQNGTLAESQGDPTKQAKVSSSSQEDLSGTIVPGSPRKSAQSAAAQSSLQTHPGAQTARYRATATALSANHDDYSALERRPSEHTLSTSPEAPSPPRSPPLLMAPPTTFFGEVRHRGFVAQHYLAHLAEEHSETTFLFLRLALFLVKMATLTRPCWPYLVNTSIGASLVAVAGLDLGIPGTMQGRGAPRRGSHNVSIAGQQAAPRSRWRWDWRASMTLLALHFAVLWATSRRGVLCPASHAAWPEWT